MPKRIETLSLAGFRGASVGVDIQFEPGKPIALIFGENGSGKSTIIDALDFVCNEQFGSIDEKLGINPKERYVVSLQKDAKDLRVALHLKGESQPWVATLTGGIPNVSGKDRPPRARILRRSRILKFINARPADRYEALEGFIALPGIESSERTLRDYIAEIKRDLNDATRAKTQAETSLSETWNDEGKPGADCISWAKERAKADMPTLTTSVATLKEVQDALEAAQRAVDAWGLSIKDRHEKEGRLQKADQAVQSLEAGAKESDLIDLLKDAQKYLPHSIRPEECPLCERPGVEVSKLIERIGVRLAEMNRTTLLKTALDTARKAQEIALTTNLNDRTALIKSGWALARVLRDSRLAEVVALKLDWPRFPNMMAEAPPSDTEEIFREAQKLQLSAKTCLDPIKKKHETETRALNQLGMIQRGLASVQENTKKAEDAEAQQKRAQTILEAMEKRRKAFTDKVLADISSEVGELCEKIHPDEGVKVRFFLNPNFRNSLESSGEFSGVKDVPPQAYYSESHLDTIGVCIFLALAKRFGGAEDIVVLDDVVTSVDAPHMERLMNLVVEEAEHFRQLIIATHNRVWLEWFKNGTGPIQNVDRIYLGSWSLTGGIRHGKSKPDIEELKELIKAVPFNRQAVSAKAGVSLECLLNHLARLYNCNLPCASRPDLTRLLNSIGSRLRTGIRVLRPSDSGETQEILLKPILDEISTFKWIRNVVGAHWDLTGLDVSDADVGKFGKAVVAFAEVLICEKCGSLPAKKADGIKCRCPGDNGLRLLPNQNPDY